MNTKKTHEQYVQELLVKNPNVKVIEKYINAKTPIKHYCCIHDVYWYAEPTNILLGQGCVQCGIEKRIKKQKKTHSQYTKELKRKNKNIEIIEEYHGAKIPILHKCKVCGHTWSAAPSDLLSGEGCPNCAGNIKKTQDEYVKMVSSISPHIIVVGTYQNANTAILHKCTIHNILWKASPISILRGSGCKQCGIEKSANAKRKLHLDYIKDVSKINNNIIVIGEYVNWKTEILHKCKLDGCEWYSRPNNILNGTGCPKCNKSHGEKIIEKILRDKNIEFETQKSFDGCESKKLLRFDFYLPKCNACIEYDGEQHYRTVDFFGGEKAFEKQKLHDKIKDDYCKEHGIKLLRIPYYKDVEEELNNFLFT